MEYAMKVATVSRMDSADRNRFSELRPAIDVDSLRSTEFDRLPYAVQTRLISDALRKKPKRSTTMQLAR